MVLWVVAKLILNATLPQEFLVVIQHRLHLFVFDQRPETASWTTGQSLAFLDSLLRALRKRARMKEEHVGAPRSSSHLSPFGSQFDSVAVKREHAVRLGTYENVNVFVWTVLVQCLAACISHGSTPVVHYTQCLTDLDTFEWQYPNLWLKIFHNQVASVPDWCCHALSTMAS